MTSAEQKAVLLEAVGKPVVLGKRPIPTPKEGQILIKLVATHLLPHDSYGRDWGLFIGHKLPWVLGADVAGIIQETKASEFQVGDRVMALSNIGGPSPDQSGLQQYAVLDANSTAKVPDLMSFEDAVTVPLNVVTSFLALFTKDFGFDFPAPWEKTGFDFSSQPLVVIGAGSNLAKLGIQLAKIVGIKQIIAIAGPANTSELKNLGATHVLDRHASLESLVEQVHAITGPENVTHIYHCHSWNYELAQALVPTSKPSRLVAVHRLDAEALREKATLMSSTYVQCSNAALGDRAPEFWKHLTYWTETKQVLPAPWKVIGGLDDVEKINAALDDYRDAKGGAQAIVKP